MCPGVLLALARFIPAGAGNTLPLSALLARNTVYPRWRGEHRSSHYFPFFFDGLSPLARGTRRQRIVRLPLHRFIPAGAGNTSTLSITTDREPVYPRWRGEHWQNKHRGTRGAGLSPLARGTLDQAVLFFQRRRFIPAGAGNAPKEIASQLNLPVYPRWRGEHPFIFVSSWRDLGLSPLARGTRTKYPSLNPRRRFIPAGAGNTIETFHAIKQAAVYPRWRGEH